MRNFTKTRLIVLVALVVGFSPNSMSQTDTSVFRYHLPDEPVSLDPARVSSIDASYFFPNVMRGLYAYSREQGLVADGAEICQFVSPLKLECKLKIAKKWSDGSTITAQDYERAFRHILSPQSKSPVAELLQNVLNAQAVFAGKLPGEKLGVRAETSRLLVFEFSKHDPEFIFKLASSVLGPIKSTNFPERSGEVVVNGPYKIVSWTKGKRVLFEPNRHFDSQGASRPNVETLFIDDDETALNLYLQNQLTFLRRLPTTLIPKYKDRDDFKQLSIARFDYIGFGPQLENEFDLRMALSYSLKFEELKKIYDALGIPGCPSLPDGMLDRERCVKFDLEKARKHFAKVSRASKAKRLTLAFSKMGGDDIKKGMEWMQGQWKKNLGLIVDLEPTEQGVYLHKLQIEPPAIFRKGVALDRPTCLSGLETFSKTGPENFIRLQDSAYEKNLEALANVQSSINSKKLCGQGVQRLLDQGRVIPLGQIHFTVLASPQFEGWSLNEMNQFDLSGLKKSIENSKEGR